MITLTANEYIFLAENTNPEVVGNICAKLSDENCNKLMAELEEMKYSKLVKTLWYNYETQSFRQQRLK